MKIFRRLLALTLAMALALPAFAQTYPTTTPVYVPTAILPATTVTTQPANVAFQTNNIGTVYIRIAGTFSLLSASVQVSEARAGTPAWTTVPVQAVLANGTRQGTITGPGLYMVHTAGVAQIRLAIASFTGTNVIVSASGSSTAAASLMLPIIRNTYTATANVSPAATPTDIISIAGNAQTIARIQRVSCQGVAPVAATNPLILVKRSTTNVFGGTTVTSATVALDPSATPASSVVTTYASNPFSLGTSTGNVARLWLPLPTTGGAIAISPITTFFGVTPDEQELVLRSASDVLAVNGNGVSFPQGGTVACSIVWTEE